MLATRIAFTALACFASAAALAAPPAKAPPVEAYVGKYPFDKVDGVSFLDHPAVRAAVTRAVHDPKARAWLLDAKGSPFPQIRHENAELVVIGCQQHACDRRNWAIYFNPASNLARVCYSATGAQSRWYNGRGGSRVLAGSCPS
jgi:hypothetical protein